MTSSPPSSSASSSASTSAPLRVGVLLLIGAALATASARAGDAAADEGARAFVDVARVLTSPRCANCHPAAGSDTPTVGDDMRPHPQGVQRGLERLGMSCRSCHRFLPSPSSRAPGAPPAVVAWTMPPAEHPMPFMGKTARALCEQLKDPKQNGERSGASLLRHVSDDLLVRWGWDPGGNRTPPPLPHDVFVARFSTWVASGMPCP